MSADPKPAPAGMSLRAAMELRYPGDRYAVFYDVPDNVGLDSRRRADAIAFGMWKSVGRLIEGFEFKASRSDWLREVKQVEKADPFIERCDRWWLVTTDATIAKLEEIPACWGWLSLTPTGLRVQKPAAKLREYSPTMDRLFVFGVLRKAAEPTTSEEYERRLTEYRRKTDAEIEERVRRGVELANGSHGRLLKKVEAFEKGLGMKLEDWRAENVAKIAAELAKISYEPHGLDAVDRALEVQQRTLANLQECLQLARDAIKPKEAP